jgi:hypothetical protein
MKMAKQLTRKDKITNLTIGFVGLLIVVLALYSGLYVFFLGGIVDLVNQLKAPVTTSAGVAFGFLKIILAIIVTLVGVIGGGLFSAFGFFGGMQEKSKQQSFAEKLNELKQDLKDFKDE